MQDDTVGMAEGNLPNSTRYISGHYIHFIHNKKTAEKSCQFLTDHNCAEYDYMQILQLATVMMNRTLGVKNSRLL